MKKYEVTLCTKLNGHIKLELTEEETELIVKLSESLKDNKTIWDGSIEIKEAYSHFDKFIKDKETKNKKKLEKGMVVHCATEEEFHRIGKMINKLYPDDIKYEDYDFKAEDEDIFNDRELCFFLRSKEWEYSRLSYYKSTGRKITESTEIE